MDEGTGYERQLHTEQRTATRSSLPVPCGRLTVARSCWSVYFGSMFSRAWNSTVSVKLADAVSRMVESASAGAAHVSMKHVTLGAVGRKLYTEVRDSETSVAA